MREGVMIENKVVGGRGKDVVDDKPKKPTQVNYPFPRAEECRISYHVMR